MQTSESPERKSMFARKKKENNGWLSSTLQRAEERMQRAEEKLDRSLEIFFRSVGVPTTLKYSESFTSHRQSGPDGLELEQEDLALTACKFQSTEQSFGVIDAFQRPQEVVPEVADLLRESSLPPHDQSVHKTGMVSSVSGGRENGSIPSSTDESGSRQNSDSSSRLPSSITTHPVSVGAKVRRRLEMAEKDLNQQLAFLRKVDQSHASDSPSVHSDGTSIISDGTSSASDGVDGLRSALAEADRNFMTWPQPLEEPEDRSVVSTGSSLTRAERERLSQRESEKRSVTRTHLLKPKQEFYYDRGKRQALEAKNATRGFNHPFLLQEDEECHEITSALSFYGYALGSLVPNVARCPMLDSDWLEPSHSRLSSPCLSQESNYGSLPNGFLKESEEHSVHSSFSQKSEELSDDSSFGRKSEERSVDSLVSRKSEDQSFKSLRRKIEELSFDSSSRAPAKLHELNWLSPTSVRALFVLSQNWSDESVIAEQSSDDDDSRLDNFSTNTVQSDPMMVSSQTPMLPPKFLENSYQREINHRFKARSPEKSKRCSWLILVVIFLVCEGYFYFVFWKSPVREGDASQEIPQASLLGQTIAWMKEKSNLRPQYIYSETQQILADRSIITEARTSQEKNAIMSQERKPPQADTKKISERLRFRRNTRMLVVDRRKRKEKTTLAEAPSYKTKSAELSDGKADATAASSISKSSDSKNTATGGALTFETCMKFVSMSQRQKIDTKRRRFKRNTRMLVVDRRYNKNVKGTRSWTGIEPVSSKLKDANPSEAKPDSTVVPKSPKSPDWDGKGILKISDPRLHWSFVIPESSKSGSSYAAGSEDLAMKWRSSGSKTSFSEMTNNYCKKIRSLASTVMNLEH